VSDALSTAFENVLCLPVMGIILLTAAYGIFVGAIPGLTATMAVGLLVPVTFFLSDIAAVSAIVTLEACAIFAGDIPTALVRIPGTPSSAAYADDAYALTRAGRQEQALGISLLFSVLGGLFGALVLIAAAPQLAKVALLFTSYEDFWLYALGLSCAAIVSRGSLLKGALALVIGLIFSTVGLSEDHTVPRFTFGQPELYAGIRFIPAMIGLFGVSEVLRNVLRPEDDLKAPAAAGRSPAPRGGALRLLAWCFWSPWRRLFTAVAPLFWRRKLAFLRSSSVGSVVGMLPGAGADIAAWISFGLSKRFSRKPQEYGSGSEEGLADATSANNSALAGAWIPALVFGIPGDSVTAIVIGVLLMKNVTPGPKIFTDPKQTVLLHGIYITFVLANLILLPLGLLAIRAGGYIVRIPRRVLLPSILLFSIVGAFAIEGSYFDIWVMLGMGILGFVLERFGVPLGPVVLGIVLGGRLEHAFIQNLALSSSPLDFFSRPLASLLGAVCILLWLLPVFTAIWRRAARDVPIE
jgi:putative tricarboxylic transport membrane protein